MAFAVFTENMVKYRQWNGRKGSAPLPIFLKGEWDMKRVKAACICQTLHFLLKEDTEPGLARRLVQEEVAAYKSGWTVAM